MVHHADGVSLHLSWQLLQRQQRQWLMCLLTTAKRWRQPQHHPRGPKNRRPKAKHCLQFAEKVARHWQTLAGCSLAFPAKTLRRHPLRMCLQTTHRLPLHRLWPMMTRRWSGRTRPAHSHPCQSRSDIHLRLRCSIPQHNPMMSAPPALAQPSLRPSQAHPKPDTPCPLTSAACLLWPKMMAATRALLRQSVRSQSRACAQ
mmetsp:Transcript_173314/g.555905  ORF Transcript_173314/g.555905 Transcript_173314/m.555905 type:complete len:201 (+) Transcript_173314:2028-2630(+)